MSRIPLAVAAPPPSSLPPPDPPGYGRRLLHRVGIVLVPTVIAVVHLVESGLTHYRTLRAAARTDRAVRAAAVAGSPSDMRSALLLASAHLRHAAADLRSHAMITVLPPVSFVLLGCAVHLGLAAPALLRWASAHPTVLPILHPWTTTPFALVPLAGAIACGRLALLLTHRPGPSLTLLIEDAALAACRAAPLTTCVDCPTVTHDIRAAALLLSNLHIVNPSVPDRQETP